MLVLLITLTTFISMARKTPFNYKREHLINIARQLKRGRMRVFIARKFAERHRLDEREVRREFDHYFPDNLTVDKALARPFRDIREKKGKKPGHADIKEPIVGKTDEKPRETIKPINEKRASKYAKIENPTIEKIVERLRTTIMPIGQIASEFNLSGVQVSRINIKFGCRSGVVSRSIGAKKGLNWRKLPLKNQVKDYKKTGYIVPYIKGFLKLHNSQKYKAHLTVVAKHIFSSLMKALDYYEDGLCSTEIFVLVVAQKAITEYNSLHKVDFIPLLEYPDEIKQARAERLDLVKRLRR